MCNNGTPVGRKRTYNTQLLLFIPLHLYWTQDQQDESERAHTSFPHTPCTKHLIGFVPCPISSDRLPICSGGSGGVNSWSEAMIHSSASRISVATWNADALRTSLTQAIALEFDTLALQELRVDEATALGLHKQAKQQGYQLVWGTLPAVTVNGKKGLLNPQIPGAGFLIKDSLGFKKTSIEALSRWEKQGRCTAIQVFLQQKWITCISVYASVEDPAPLLQDLADYAISHSHQDVIIMGDFNQNTRDGHAVNDLSNNHWCPLTIWTPFDFITFKRKNATSCIDTIVISPAMTEYCQPVQTLDAFKHGHHVLYTWCYMGYHHLPSWEQHCPDKDPDSPICNWDEVFTQFTVPHHPTTVQQDWETWCKHLSDATNSQHPYLGIKPNFRLRDQAKIDSTTFKLRQAIQNNDETAVHHCRDQIKKHQANAIRKWRNKITPTLQKSHTWIKNLFAWIKPKSPPTPICIQSSKFGSDGSTTCISETLLEVKDFLKQLYKNVDASPDPVQQMQCAYQPVSADVEALALCLKCVINKQNVEKAHGLDGLTVAHFKSIDEKGILCLAALFLKCLHVGETPTSWLDCRVACIPKKVGQLRVQDLRPLCIAPIVLRLFSKILLTVNCESQHNVSSLSVGGITGRQGMHAWLLASLHAEDTWRHDRRTIKNLQGIAIDTEKFFDAITFEHAAEALRSIQFPVPAISAWMYAVRNINRYAAVSGAISIDGFKPGRGIPQGDPLSMLVAAAALGQWAARIPTPLKVNHVFVDDRLLLDDCHSKLQGVFDFTRNWDREHCFNTLPKTHAFGTNPIHQNVVWLDGATVKREEGNLIYLGIPLPFLNVKRETFYAPIIARLCAALNKVARARIPFHQAAAVVATKVAPSLAYAAMIVRPTCKQLSVLRYYFYKACADRHFATHDAQALLLHRTHFHDPEAAMTYASLCGWRRALQTPFFLQWLRQHWPTHSRRKAQGKGPLNLLSQDIEWIQCDFDLETLRIISRQNGKSIQLSETNKDKFQHFIREQIRIVFAKRLQLKHNRWNGVEEIDLAATTALFRKMHPQAFGRTALMRLLSNAHATPHRLHKQNIVATPACNFCGCEDADVLHIAYHCPKFQFVRDAWSPLTHTWPGWPSCAQHCLVATVALPEHLRKHWHVVQLDIARLFETWMAFRRNGSLCHSITAESHDIEIQRDAEEERGRSNLSHDAVQRYAPLAQPPVTFPAKSNGIDLEWTPPNSTWALHKWGASQRDYNVLFSFWTKWSCQTFPGAVTCHNWTVAFLIFMQQGGKIASFVHRCPNLGTVIWKFKNLSCAMLQAAWPENPEFESIKFHEDAEVHWCPRMPPARTFPNNFFAAFPWDLRDTCVKFLGLQTQIAISNNMQYKHHLLDVPQFLSLFPDLENPSLRDDFLNPLWVGRRRRKSRILRWEMTALNLPKDNTVRSITAKPISFWNQLAAEDIKKMVSPPKSTKRQFVCLHKYFTSVLRSIGRHLEASDHHSLPHLPDIQWSEDIPICSFCSVTLNFIQSPDSIHRPCNHATLQSKVLLMEKLTSCQKIIDDLANIIARL